MAVNSSGAKAFSTCSAALKLIANGKTPSSSATCAITTRIKLYAKRWAHTSLRTIAGDWQRKIPICITDFSERRSSSAYQRSRYNAANSTRGASAGSSSVLATTSDSVRNPSCATRTRTSRTARVSGSRS